MVRRIKIAIRVLFSKYYYVATTKNVMGGLTIDAKMWGGDMVRVQENIDGHLEAEQAVLDVIKYINLFR